MDIESMEMSKTIKTGNILKLSESDLINYKLHLACFNGIEQPLDVYLRDRGTWVDWNAWRGNKNDFNREYIFSLIQFYHESDKWLFGGIFRIVKRFDDWKDTEVGYGLELTELHKELIGRLIIDFHRHQGMRGRAFLLESHYKNFNVSEILKKPFDGNVFPGYERLTIKFPALETVFKYQKNDWKGALENVKGIYVIVDESNGKQYVGSAYGDFGIWSRWMVYVATGHGFNDELTKLISERGIEYARKNFRFSLLEYLSMKTDNEVIRERESYWKEVLQTKKFGYNKN